MGGHPVPTHRLAQRLREAAQSVRAPFAGGQVTWRRCGSGAPLVLLHGGHGSWLHRARNIEPLATRYTVWAPDLPGYPEFPMNEHAAEALQES